MTKLKLIFILVFLFCVYLTGISQTKKTIDSLQIQYQICLDKGQYMFGCSKNFYSQMDSMLNVVYFKLRSTLDTSQQSRLKKEQKFWLTKRDNYFKKTFNEFKKNNPDKSPYGAAFGVQDDAMTMFDNNAKFVKDRILFLLNRLNK